MKTPCRSAVTRKKLSSWVRPGVWLTRARPLRPSKPFRSEDLPTFDRPAKATSGRVAGGNWDGCVALVTNSALRIFMVRGSEGVGSVQENAAGVLVSLVLHAVEIAANVAEPHNAEFKVFRELSKKGRCIGG